jgi:hypothetical protein
MLDSEYVFAIKQVDYLADITKNNYIRNLQTIKKKTGINSIHEILLNPTMVMETLSKIENKKTRMSLMVSVMSTFKHSHQMESLKSARAQWITFCEPLSIEIETSRESRLPTRLKLEQRLIWEDVLRTRDSYQIGSTEHCFLSIICFITRRQSDFRSIKIYRDYQVEPTEGHIYIPYDHRIPGHIHITEGKRLCYGEYFHEILPSNVRESVQKSLELYPRSHLFMGKIPCDTMNSSSSTRSMDEYKTVDAYRSWSNSMLKRIFENENVSMVALRNSKAVYNHQFPDWTDEKMTAEARLMAASKEMCELYALNYENTDKPTVRRFPWAMPLGLGWDERKEWTSRQLQELEKSEDGVDYDIGEQLEISDDIIYLRNKLRRLTLIDIEKNTKIQALKLVK